MNIATAILQFIISVAFNKFFDALKITTAGFKLNVLKKTSESGEGLISDIGFHGNLSKS